MNLKENRTRWYLLVQILLCVGLIFVVYGLTFNRTRVLGLQDQKNVDSTKTALAGTSQALMGPFPTATLPTRTPTASATATPLISATPTVTRSVTPRPSNTPTRFISATPRDSNRQGSSGGQNPGPAPQATNTNPPPPTSANPPPTVPPVPTDQPTEPPAPTDLPTLPPIVP